MARIRKKVAALEKGNGLGTYAIKKVKKNESTQLTQVPILFNSIRRGVITKVGNIETGIRLRNRKDCL